jgi:4'-phosphopantetheinyl transferase
LTSGELHVWQADLRLPDSAAAALTSCLSPDEADRASRFATVADARRYRSARGILRQILGRYLGLAAPELRFDYGDKGKPRLIGLTAAPEFNLSHCGDVLLLAVADTADVGIDIERIRRITHAGRIVHRLFDPAARAEWVDATAPAREAIFFVHWTRLEALGKLHGGGIWHAAEARAGDATGMAPTVRDLESPPGYRAAVATSGPIDHLLRFTWTYTG